MGLDYKVRRHPSRQELVAFAESLVDRRAAVPAPLAAHVRGCETCAHEANFIRASLEFTASASSLEPSEDLTAQILMQSRSVRVSRRPRRLAVAISGLKGLAYTGALAALAVVVFGALLGDPGVRPMDNRDMPAAAAREQAAVESLEKTVGDVRRLAAAVQSDADAPRDARELAQRRALTAMDADITAALSALERNPGCRRASGVVHANVTRQAEALRTLYVERSL